MMPMLQALTSGRGRLYYIRCCLYVVFMASGVTLLHYGIHNFKYNLNKSVPAGSTEVSTPVSNLSQIVTICLFVLGPAGLLVGMVAFWWDMFGQLKTNIYKYIILLTIALLVSLLIILGIGTVCLSYRNTRRLEEAMYTSLWSDQLWSDQHNGSQLFDWDNMQSKLDCCGVKDPSDWRNTTWYNQTGRIDTVPLACCTLANETIGNVSACYASAYDEDAIDRDHWVHITGCATTLDKWLESNFIHGLYIAMLIVFLVQFTILVSLSVLITIYKVTYMPIANGGQQHLPLPTLANPTPNLHQGMIIHNPLHIAPSPGQNDPSSETVSLISNEFSNQRNADVLVQDPLEGPEQSHSSRMGSSQHPFLVSGPTPLQMLSLSHMSSLTPPEVGYLPSEESSQPSLSSKLSSRRTSLTALEVRCQPLSQESSQSPPQGSNQPPSKESSQPPSQMSTQPSSRVPSPIPPEAPSQPLVVVAG